MAKGHRSHDKRLRNENKDTRPSAKVSYARVSVTKACFVLDAIRGKDVHSALAIVAYNPTLWLKRYREAFEVRYCECREQQRYEGRRPLHR